MKLKAIARSPHICSCPACIEHPHSKIAREHKCINQLSMRLDERRRRLFAGFWADTHGIGGIEHIALITGMSRMTVRRGKRELARSGTLRRRRVRARGGGRKKFEVRCPRLLGELDRLLADTTAGDPMTGSKWTHKSTEKLMSCLRRSHIRISSPTIARVLKERQYSLRTNRKRLAGVQKPDRDLQFRYLTRLRHWYITMQLPAISIDAKKRELVGNFKNPGRSWRREPRVVLDHDFERLGVGHAIPYGVYDLAHNDGLISIGVSRETAALAANAIRKWWTKVGCRRYPGAKHLLIEADCGGANGNRKLIWKLELQRLADDLQLAITVTHYPPGASKWNPIEHRMFSLISANWAAEPLLTYETMLKFIRRTHSTKGFNCKAYMDHTIYKTRIKVSKHDRESILLKPRPVLPAWNYTIFPRPTG